MGYVEAATTGPAARPARGGQTAADTTAMPDGPPGPARNFASIFAMTRQSAWLDSLLNRRGESVGTRTGQQQRTRQALKNQPLQETPNQVRHDEADKTPSRSERLRAAREERPSSSERAQKEDHSSRKEIQDRRSDRPATREHAEPGRQTAESPEQIREPQPEQPPTDPDMQAGQTNVGPQDAGAEVTTQVPAPVPPTATASNAVGSTVSSPGGNTAVLSLPASVPGPGVPGVTTAQAMPVAELAPMPVQSAGDKSAGGNAGTPQDSAAATGGAAQGGDAAAKPADANTEFQDLLQQLGRERSPAVMRPAAPGAARQLPDGEIKLARSEAVEQLARIVRSNLGARNSSMTLQLDPPELGHLRVDVRMHEQNLLLRFQAETQAARGMLETRLGELRQALEQHGIQLDRVEVSVRPPVSPDQQGHGADGQPAQHNLPQGGEPGSGQAHGQQQGGGQESYGSDSTYSQSPEGWSGNDATVYQGLQVDEAGVPAETGVDLIV